jgi:hypothetical protein
MEPNTNFEIFENDDVIVNILKTDKIEFVSKHNDNKYEIPREVFVDIAVQLISHHKDEQGHEFYKKLSYEQLIDKYIENEKKNIKPYVLYYNNSSIKSYERVNRILWYMTDDGSIIALCSTDANSRSDMPETFYLNKYISLYDFLGCHAYIEDKRILFKYTELNSDSKLAETVIDNFLNNSFENYIHWNKPASKVFHFELETNSYYLFYDFTKTYVGVAKYKSPEIFPVLTPLTSLPSNFGFVYLYTDGE